MKIKATLLAMSASLSTALVPNVAADPPPPPAVVSLVAAENEFAAHSVATDMRQAFMRALGTEGILLRPTPVPGGPFMEKRPAPPIELNWRPTFAYVAASGDVGITSGPWRLLSKTNPAEPPSYGHFISLWKRNATGRWMLAFDNGISHPDPSFADAFLVAPPTGLARTTDAKIEATLKRFAERASAVDYNTAVKEFAAADARVYRDGSAPMHNHAAIQKLASQWRQHRLVSLPMVSGTSSTKDFVYRLFEVRDVEDSAETSGKLVAHAFTVWRATIDGEMELMLDVITILPAQRQ
ncbi:MAG: hypothetical protein WCL29_03355 [Pseudomonadota bacterium]